MSDIYVSPIRGKPVLIKGSIIGKGTPGYIFSEDMMLQDNTGLIYLNYESYIPLFGNLIFGWKKVSGLVGKESEAYGWFLRGATHHLELSRLVCGKEVIKSSIRFWRLFWSIALMVVGSLVLLWAVAVA